MSTNLQYDNIIIRVKFVLLITCRCCRYPASTWQQRILCGLSTSFMVLNTNCVVFVDGIVWSGSKSATIHFMTYIIHVWQRRSWLLPSTSDSRCRHPAPGQDLIPLQGLHVFAHSRDPHPVIKLWCQVPFTKSKTIFQIEMYCMQCFLKNKYIKSRTFNDKNRRIIKRVTVLKELLPHLATTGTYSLGDWRCVEAWREQTLVYPPLMCQQRLIYCTWS